MTDPVVEPARWRGQANRFLGRIILIRCIRVKHIAWTKLGRVFRVFSAGILEKIGFLLRVEMVQIAKPFIKAVIGGQELVSIPEMVFAELCRRIALRF